MPIRATGWINRGNSMELQRVTRINKVSYETVCIHMDKAAHVVCIASHKETPKRLKLSVVLPKLAIIAPP